jgi:hypothetical protein
MDFFFWFTWVSGQLARTTTNPTAHWTSCKPSEHIKYHGSDRHAHENSNPEQWEEPRPSVHHGFRCLQRGLGLNPFLEEDCRSEFNLTWIRPRPEFKCSQDRPNLNVKGGHWQTPANKDLFLSSKIFKERE